MSQNATDVVLKVKSPVELTLKSGKFSLSEFDTFDSNYTEHNKLLAKSIGISEEDAFIMGNLGKDWTSNLMKGRMVRLRNGDVRYFRNSYIEKFKYSGSVSNKCTKA